VDASKRKLVVVVTHGPNGDRASIAFTVANASLSAGMDVAVFLTSDGVDLCREGSADHSHAQPFLPLAELIAKFAASGGTLLACGSCFTFRGMRPEWNIPQVTVAGVTALAEWLAAGAATISF
jgi:predicted peroxiredoxin